MSRIGRGSMIFAYILSISFLLVLQTIPMCHSLSPAPQLQRPWFNPTIVFYGWECMQVNWKSRHKRGLTKNDETNENVKTARMVPTQDFSVLGPSSLPLRFDSFLLRAMHWLDQLYQIKVGEGGTLQLCLLQ